MGHRTRSRKNTPPRFPVVVYLKFVPDDSVKTDDGGFWEVATEVETFAEQGEKVRVGVYSIDHSITVTTKVETQED